MGRISLFTQKNRSDKISGGNQFGSDIFQNGSDIIRYPTVILSPALNSVIIVPQICELHLYKLHYKKRVINKSEVKYKNFMFFVKRKNKQ